MSGFGYLVFSFPAPSQSFAHLVYLLLKSWFLSHSLLKFLANSLSGRRSVWQRGGDQEGLYSCCSAAHIRDQLDRRTPGKSGVMGFLHQIRIYNEIIPDDADNLHTHQRTHDYLELT
jgi:hypothetical protein